MSDLIRSLALAQDDFGEAEPQLAMMINARELDVLIGQVDEFVGGFVDIDATRPRIFEKLFDEISVHFGDSSTRKIVPSFDSPHHGALG